MLAQYLSILLLFIVVYGQQQKNESPHLALNQDELSTSKHRHAVEHLEPDPAMSIFGISGRNPLQRTTTISSRPINKKHAGSVNNRRGN
jgi:hypothetical protein